MRAIHAAFAIVAEQMFARNGVTFLDDMTSRPTAIIFNLIIP
jgi:hypothetical protein